MNAIKLKIGDEVYTGRVSTPLTVQTTLNDTLDSAQFILPYLQRAEPFEPMTDVELQIGESEAVIWLLADDQVQEIRGTGKYTHTVTLVEYTKITERILMEAKSFTNPLVADYSDGNISPEVYMYATTASNIWIAGSKFATGTTDYYDIPAAVPRTIEIPVHDISLLIGDNAFSSCNNPNNINLPFRTRIYFSEDPPILTDSRYIPSNGTLVYEYEYGFDTENGVLVKPTFPIGYYAKVDGYYTIIYIYSVTQTSSVAYYAAVTTLLTYEKVPRRDPYTIQKVIDILLNIVVPHWGGESSGWMLSPGQAELPIMQEVAPEFSFTNSRSLWENLREVGSAIHGIPRVIKKPGEIKEVRFDFLGGTTTANMSMGRKISNSEVASISNFTSGLEAMAENLVNADGISNGSIVEPYSGGYKTLRTATETARIQEGTSFIETSLPIESIVKVEAYFTHDGKNYSCNITPYVFEKDDYNLLLSYSSIYPKAKCYALYYSRGSRNINGLWFKATDGAGAFADSMKNYAIANILSQEANLDIGYFDQLSYPNISFRVGYIPTVTARIHHYRPDAKRGAGLLANNQAANKLSAYALGENMRGQLAMLSTSTRSELWLFPKYEDIPKAGELVDDSLYISSVTARVYPGYCEAQIEMSENYNEQGAYVELPSHFRQYEIPAGNDRYTVIDEFCYISDNSEDDDKYMIARHGLKSSVGKAFDPDASTERITITTVSTYDYDNKVTQDHYILLPVMSLAIGNSLHFGFSMADNFSAGMQSVDCGSQYRMNQAVRYGDKYYSTAKYIAFDFFCSGQGSDPVSVGNMLPLIPDTFQTAPGAESPMGSTAPYALVWHKDSADTGNISYQLHLMTDSGYIIGPNFAPYCSTVLRDQDENQVMVYGFNHRIDQLGNADISSGVLLPGVTPSVSWWGDADSEKLIMNFRKTQEIEISFKAWAIVRGGKIMLAKNEPNLPEVVFFNFKRSLKK